jgi:hypothetical protein
VRVVTRALALLLPGAAHVYLGRPVVGLVGGGASFVLLTFALVIERRLIPWPFPAAPLAAYALWGPLVVVALLTYVVLARSAFRQVE